MIDLVLTLIGTDRPGIVDAVSTVVAANGGNWLDSRMAHLAGKFAGVLCVEVADEQVAALEAALAGLGAGGLHVIVERSAPTEVEPPRITEIELLGLDRPGLVREIADLLATHGINVEDLTTERRHAAMSGGSVFHAQIRAAIPDGVDMTELRHGLERLAADLMVEIRLAEAIGSVR